MANETQPTKTELRAKAEELVNAYNDAVQNGRYDESYRLNGEIEQTVNEYTGIVRGEVFDLCKAADDPMIEAITRLSFTSIGTKDEKHGDAKIPVRIVVDKERQIDLLKLHKYIEGGIGVDKNWAYIVEKLNFLLTAQKAIDLGLDPKAVNDSYAMAEISKGIDMGKTPTSKTNILNTLQTVVSAMIGEQYRATSHDVNFLMSVYSRKSRKALTVTCANHKYMHNYIAEICHRIVTGKTYAVEYKAVKK